MLYYVIIFLFIKDANKITFTTKCTIVNVQYSHIIIIDIYITYKF